MNDIILVTGGSGYVGSTVLVQLLKENYTRVKTTVRDKTKQLHLIDSLKNAGVTEEQLMHLHFYITDLLNDAGWEEAVTGTKYILHIASPIAFFEKDKVKTALEGTLRVLKFARDNGVKRVIATSSFLTVGFSKVIPKDRLYNDTDFTPLEDAVLSDYHQSKVIAETAAWDFIKKESGSSGLELVTIHPGLVLGPPVGIDNVRQVWFVKDLLEGKTSAFVENSGAMSITDVRDVADLHVRALAAPGIAGRRLLSVHDDAVSWVQLSQILHQKLPAEYGKKVALVTKVLPEVRHGDNSFSKTLGWKPHTTEETVLDTANRLISFGVVSK